MWGVGDVLVKDACALLSRGMIGDNVVNAYMKLLEKESERRRTLRATHAGTPGDIRRGGAYGGRLAHERRYMITSTYFHEREAGEPGRPWSRLWVGMTLDTLIIVPIHHNQGSLHWKLGIVDLRRRVVMVLDSNQVGDDWKPDGLESAKRITNAVDLGLKHLYEARLSEGGEDGLGGHSGMEGESDWTYAVPSWVPQQGKTMHCGAYVCVFARQIVWGEKLRLKCDDAPAEREHMLRTICGKNDWGYVSLYD